MIERSPADQTAEVGVLLVDDHTLFRQALRQALIGAGIRVVGEASNGRAGAQLARELRPDVTVMDLHMPLLDGVGAVRTVLADQPNARILMLTVSTDEDDVIEALHAGASGYVLKTAPPEDVVRAIRSLLEGDSVISPEVAGRLIDHVRATGHAGSEPVHPPTSLTPRELEILRLLAEGKENHEIAEALYISSSTAKNHVANVLAKLGLENRVQAAVYAVRKGLA